MSAVDFSILFEINERLKRIEEQSKPAEVEAVVARVLERRQSGALVPFQAIKGGSAAGARMWLNRHPEIAALGKRVGKRLLFSRDEVMAALKGGAK